MTALLVVLMIVAFIVIDVLVRYISKRVSEAKARKERLAALDIGLNLDFTHEAKTLKRVEVSNPLARILAVDDEPVILDSFRKILVVAGYAIDTVESGREALGLVQKHKYDFVFTDLKMPEMDGLDVVKGVKHFSPETDVVMITGYATIESAVDAMKFGAMDYVQKPFTEDELVEFTKKCLIRRQDRIEKRLETKVHVGTSAKPPAHEIGLPGGVFVSDGHVWVNVTIPGLARIGMDDFARKMIGRIDEITLPKKDLRVQKGEALFEIRQGERQAGFTAPISGIVHYVNTDLMDHPEWLSREPYGNGWICSIKPEKLSEELKELRLGDQAAGWYEGEIERFTALISKRDEGEDAEVTQVRRQFVEGQLEELEPPIWQQFCKDFLRSPDKVAAS